MGAALVSENNQHIKIDILASVLNQKQKQQLSRPLFFLSAMTCMVFAWYSAAFWLDEWKYASTHERWPVGFALILPAGFIVMSLHLLILSLISQQQENFKARL